MNKLPKARISDLVIQELKDEVLIYDLKINKAFCLNQTAAMVYQLADGRLTVEQIADKLSVKLKTLVGEDFVRLALSELERDGLLEEAGEPGGYLGAVSRREAIRRVGLATMIALPVITGLVAPTAAHAQSGGGVALFGACTTTSQCQSGLTCKFCEGSSCGTGSYVCCQNNVGLKYGSGYQIYACTTSSSCASSAQFDCCSGKATFKTTGCNGVVTYGTCTCN